MLALDSYHLTISRPPALTSLANLDPGYDDD